MSNLRPMIFLSAGCLVLSLVLWGQTLWRDRGAVEHRVRPNLSALDPADVQTFSIAGARGTPDIVLSRTNGMWRLEEPFTALADPAAVTALLDRLAQAPVQDCLNAEDLRDIARSPADFGFVPPRRRITLRTGRTCERLLFGGPTPSGGQVYACVEGKAEIVTVDRAVFEATLAGPESFRRTALVEMALPDVTGLALRVPERPFLRLARDEDGWRLTLPTSAPADQAAVASLLSLLKTARAGSFVWPSEKTPPEERTLRPRAEILARYGIAPSSADAFSVTLDSAAEGTDEIVFGAPAGTNQVYALVQGGRAVACVDVALATACRLSEDALRDTRLFPCADAEIQAITVRAMDAAVYRLAQGDDHVWRLEAPVAAPADPAAAEAFVKRVLALRRNERAETGLRITVARDATNRLETVVAASVFPDSLLVNLRSKILLVLTPSAVRRLALRSASGVAAVEWDAARRTWNLLPPEEGDEPTAPVLAVRVNPAAVERLVNALARVEAVRVETLSATSADFTRCGLDKPVFTLSVDMSDAKAPHREIVFGGAAPDGGRYATVSGSNAVFILSRNVVADLTASLVE